MQGISEYFLLPTLQNFPAQETVLWPAATVKEWENISVGLIT